LQREYARAPCGEKIEDVRRGTRFERTNIIGALCAGKHFSIKCYKQTTDGEFFETWFKDCLLKEIPCGYTVIMDNASFHRKSKLKKISRGKTRLIFLPPYSPDYNPIEKSWTNMKRYLRSNLHDFTSVDSAIYNYFQVPAI
jgi:transposase